MGIISLEGLEFFAYHGFYKEEQAMGNRYGVDISVGYNFEDAAREDSLNTTINYERLYKTVEREMKISSKLLEHLAGRIIAGVFLQFPHIEWCEVAVYKYNPPVGGVCRAAKVLLRQTNGNLPNQ